MDHLTIEPFRGEYYVVYKHGYYGKGSVLEGQPKRSFQDAFDTLEEAKKAYPGAEVLEHSTKIKHSMPTNPPSWFDPADAGERWDDDY